MKKFLLLICICPYLLFSCEDKVTYEIPEAIKGESVVATPGPGTVMLSWSSFSNVDNLYYVACTYTNPETGEEYKKLASKYSDTLIIDNLLNRYGPIDFTLQPFNRGFVGGEKFTISAQAEPAPKTISLNGESEVIPLTPEQVYVQDPEPSEGPKENLVNGNKNDFYHSRWSGNPIGMPSNIVIDLKKEVQGASFSYTTRNNGGAGNHPRHIKVFGSNEFDGTTFNPENFNAELLLEVSTGLPNGAKLDKTIPGFLAKQPFKYLWIQIVATHGNTKFYALAELTVSENFVTVNDPETANL
jgi:F5/8 type C domain.